MVVYWNVSTSLGTIIDGAATHMMGSTVLVFFSLLLIFLAIMAAYRIPMVLSVLILLPILTVLMAYNSAFIVPGAIAIVITAIYFSHGLLS